MTTLISILLVLASIALVIVVIVQKSKGGGLAASFSGAHNIMGVRQSNNAIEKATWYLMTSIFVLCIAYTAFDGKGTSQIDSLQQKVEEKAKTTQTPGLPSLGGQQGAATAPAGTAPTAAPQQTQAPATTEQPKQN